MNWIELTSVTQLSELLHSFNNKPDTTFIIFKNSSRCGASRMAKTFFEKHFKASVPAYLVNVVENRPVSNEITKLFNIQHESPQVLVIKKNKCIYNRSHSSIDPSEILTVI
jgi:bacillithiol system protein YtxJ